MHIYLLYWKDFLQILLIWKPPVINTRICGSYCLHYILLHLISVGSVKSKSYMAEWLPLLYFSVTDRHLYLTFKLVVLGTWMLSVLLLSWLWTVDEILNRTGVQICHWNDYCQILEHKNMLVKTYEDPGLLPLQKSQFEKIWIPKIIPLQTKSNSTKLDQ